MNNETAMIVDIPFNTDTNPFWPEFDDRFIDVKKQSKTKDWIDYRIDIFMKYTGKSLINQTNQDFKCVVRYAKESENLIFDALSKYPKLPENIIFTDDGDSYIEKLIDGYKYIYHIRIDSDNMFSSDYIEELSKVKYYEELQCILSQNGYLYDSNENRLADMFHTSPSVYALVYTVDDFICGFQHRLENSHWGAVKLVKEVIESHSYALITHKKNIDNNFDLILQVGYPLIKTKEMFGEEKETVLKEFNLI